MIHDLLRDELFPKNFNYYVIVSLKLLVDLCKKMYEINSGILEFIPPDHVRIGM
jgi:hypothetical protein